MKKPLTYLSLLLFLFISCNNVVQNNEEYNSLIEKGTLNFQQDRLESAIGNFKQAIFIDSSRMLAYYRLGITQTMLCNQGKTNYCQKAIKTLEKVVNKKPDYEKVNYNIGIAYFNVGKYKKALYYFDNAIKKDSTDIDYYVNRGYTNLMMGDTIKACHDFEKAILLGDGQSKKHVKLFCENLKYK